VTIENSFERPRAPQHTAGSRPPVAQAFLPALFFTSLRRHLSNHPESSNAQNRALQPPVLSYNYKRLFSQITCFEIHTNAWGVYAEIANFSQNGALASAPIHSALVGRRTARASAALSLASALRQHAHGAEPRRYRRRHRMRKSGQPNRREFLGLGAAPAGLLLTDFPAPLRLSAFWVGSRRRERSVSNGNRRLRGVRFNG
jgi:hypothetical protein